MLGLTILGWSAFSYLDRVVRRFIGDFRRRQELDGHCQNCSAAGLAL